MAKKHEYIFKKQKKEIFEEENGWFVFNYVIINHKMVQIR